MTILAQDTFSKVKNILAPVQQGFVGGFYVRMNGPFSPESKPCMVGHYHLIDHVSYVVSGSVSVLCQKSDGTETRIVVAADHFILIPARTRHTFWALQPNTRWYCLFAEAEATKLIDQKIIRDSISKLETHGEDVSELRSMLIEGNERDGDSLFVK